MYEPVTVGENQTVTLHDAPAARVPPVQVVPPGKIPNGGVPAVNEYLTVDADVFFTVNTFEPTSPKAT